MAWHPHSHSHSPLAIVTWCRVVWCCGGVEEVGGGRPRSNLAHLVPEAADERYLLSSPGPGLDVSADFPTASSTLDRTADSRKSRLSGFLKDLFSGSLERRKASPYRTLPFARPESLANRSRSPGMPPVQPACLPRMLPLFFPLLSAPLPFPWTAHHTTRGLGRGLA